MQAPLYLQTNSGRRFHAASPAFKSENPL